MSTPRAQQLLAAPILPTLLRLAAPGVALVAFQIAVSIADLHFVGRLGIEPLAGIALVFPLVMLLQMMSAGAMGGGVSSAVARALGAGDARAARSLVVHATLIGIGMGVVFTLVALLLGAPIYRLLGGKAQVLAQALAYSNLLFAGSVLIWLANTFASVLRGSGNTLTPAVALAGSALVHIPLSAGLVLGIGPLPALGIEGAAIAYLCGFGCATLGMGGYLWRSALRPRRADLKLEARRFGEILRVGALSSLSALQTVLTTIVLTGLVGSYGIAALAGYGVGVRTELLQIPLVFAIGQALVPLVGTAIGAGNAARAKRIAWTGAALAGMIGLVIGLAVAVFPHAWVGLFSDDPAVLATSSQYLRIVGPCYPFLAVGVALYFASQGARSVLWPMLATSARLVLVVVFGLAAVKSGAPLPAIFALIAAAMVVYGTITGWAVRKADWSR